MPQCTDWRKTALNFARLLRERPECLEPEVEHAVRTGLPADGAVLVLCSGGADSVAATLWTATHPALADRPCGLFYCDHGLRPEAESEADFVRQLAHAFSFSFHLGQRSNEDSARNEDDLRQLREAALARVIEAQTAPIQAIVTGHQADDVAENLLFRLTRGSGLSGLSGMRPVQLSAGWPVRLRPLLRWRRDALRTALVRVGARWCEDSSNQSDQYTRNRIRKQVLPALHQALPERDATEGLLAAHRELMQVDAWIEAHATAFLDQLEEPSQLPQSALQSLPELLQRRVLQKFIRRETNGLEATHNWLQAIQRSQPGFTLQLNPELQMELKKGCFRIRAAGTQTSAKAFFGLTFDPSSRLELPCGSSLTCEPVELTAALKSEIIAGRFSPAKVVWVTEVTWPLHVRSWQNGDRYQPLGAPGSRKLHDCFIDAGIERVLRAKLPIICDAEGNILWVPGLPPSHPHRLRSNTTRALRLTYQPS